jgi:putative aminopeptidase FrvX
MRYMNEATLALFRELTELPGAPGFEGPVREFLRRELAKYTEEIVEDRLGGLFGVLRGDAGGPRVMVAGHMDEVGFMVTAITDNGMLKFQPLGGWTGQVLQAQRIQVITKNGPVVGVIASTPPHLLKEAERNAPVEIEQLLLDIGADSREQAAAFGVRPGLPIVPVTPFTPLADPKKILAKAWDNRYGVGLAVELAAALHGKPHPNTVFTGATVQEEVGLRGADAAARLIEPDIFYCLDVSPAADTTGDRHANGQIGKGVLLRILDRTMIPHPGLVEFILDTAETHRIPYQYYVSRGGTDAGNIHRSGIGVPSAVIGVCARYIHTSAAILHTDDYDAAKELLIKLVQATDRTTLATICGR